ncbi:MAG: penicillin-binding protein 2, partial [Flavobacteriales bacterium]|nr:penicillin-binding protein 2 [Flavobacteriales bacterium]
MDDSSALGLLATQAAQIRKEYSRWYPHNSSGAHVIGYVGPISKDELLLNENAEITDLVGRTGLERAFNTLLTGTVGEIEYEVTALGEANRVIQEKPMIPGAVIKTTLDPYLTAIAQKAMENNKGAVIIADAKTGALLAVVSSPSYDPNVFTKFTQTNEEQALR